ncbi:MAG: LPS export ABC transporter ATP-binding protein [Ignavibacteria bacterium]|nr:LPS export ABC transporter ATP-binding protein [Ignavibacteria bacterium]MBK7254088.1 LPS export ABC transporter ATP-binding protein [Ignavibacteria bacterium]MBK8384016.1 LPS export ABC transporter ATP-binding protein [Ignavibacteria bacterium]MBK9405348.1 LPS export ABC transporter ATP-binding protein [Ignavibacteria bacterium]
MLSRLKVSNIVKEYGKRCVVNNVSLELKQGEIVGLLGPNGAGKTTTFYMICGMIRPDEGEIEFDRDNITKLPMYKRARLGIGYLPQEASVFRKMTVRENIMSILQFMDLDKKEKEEKCETLLNDFHISKIRDSKGYTLSGGERRRTEIARCLATDPKFILLDEPFAGIDPIASEEIMKIVAALKSKGIGVLITDHNVHETLSIVDRAYILIDGKIFRSGSADELANDEMVKKLYLGENFNLDRYLLNKT